MAKMTKKELDKISEKIHKDLMESPVWRAYEQGFEDGIKYQKKKMVKKA